jgi:uncharacterized protein
MQKLVTLLLSSVFLFQAVAPPASAAEGIAWVPYSDAVFQRAKAEGKFVLLDLEAVWCHWCHVMDEETYRDPEVIKLMNSKYIAVKVDQDARPDLSNRYQDYGWPATIVFNSSGGEIVKRSGYINPKAMTGMLKAVIKDPTPGPSIGKEPTLKYNSDAFLSAALRKELQSKHIAGYDDKEQGWGTYNKFLDWDSVEYAMTRARGGDAQARKMATGTLNAQLKLIDPVWGGVYQYSTDGDWNHAHFEKIMSMQAEDMRIYSLAYQQFENPTYLNAAKNIARYLNDFLLSPEGAFYTSQDADVVKGKHSGDYFKLNDAQRRKQGIPRIDKHIYSRENGWAITGLAALYAASGEKRYLDQAIKAAKWIHTNRALPGGGYRHDAADSAGPFLGDSLAMARAFLALYSVTGDRQWLKDSEQTADFIAEHFADKGAKSAGLLTSEASKSAVHKPLPLLDENIMAARFFNSLYHATGRSKYKETAALAMRYVATPEVARTHRILVAGPLLADMELNSEPAHITVIGGKEDPAARELFQSAIRYPSGYKRVEWLDHREGPLPNTDVEFPPMKKAAAFACANKRCSLPVFQPEAVAAMVDRLNGK